jgi:O-antigen/teichoic acid export membrane protein
MPTALGAMLGVTVGACVPALVGALALGRAGRGRPEVRTAAEHPEAVLHEVVANSHALLAFFALSGVDVLVAGLVLDEHDSGLYAAGLIITKAVLFLPQFVVIVAFPSMASPVERHRVYVKGLLLVAAAGIAATVGAVVFSDFAIAFVGGDEYAEIEPYVGLFAALGMVLAMIQLMVYEVVARQHRASVLILWAGLVAVVSTAAYVDSVGSLVLSVTVVNLVVLLTLVVSAMRHRTKASTG